ncbi:uncharacterized protein DUF5017 [Mucilaginibacter gracilis]|uniref:Uncharacterized protein DUF5017 n=1 Tax=Mucilaginibacter gracilis TaxID=423350 RepID=A0A495ITN6_9SPHI|nr:DUF5017 domain-containing protein [Mucilaginibacter gracilis]RKR80127.1 uncharacterized protein DUF5017 [Mucilaginibacter gracilis]
MRNRYFIITALLLACVACSKQIAVKPVTFDAASFKNNGTATTTFTNKDTVQFRFTGNPDEITFFSGEAGKNYDYRNRTSVAGTPNLQFSTIRATGAQANSLAVLVSTDFKGVVANMVYGVLTRDTVTTNANIAAATWTDITGRATLSTGATTAVASGVIDLSDFLTQAKPVYIAFKYTATAGTIQNKWTVSALSVNNVLADGSSYVVANLNAPTTSYTNYGNVTYAPGWAVSYDVAKNANKYAWVFTDKTSLVITGATTVPLATAPAEAWAVMGPVDLTRVTPDAGVAIKAISATLTGYSYNYTTAGTYNAVFVASNVTNSGISSVVKTIPVTVTP